GRVSKVTGLIAKLLNLKPVVSIDQEGNGIILEKALSIKKNTKIIVEEFRRAFETKGIERYCVVHSNGEKRAKDLEDKLRDICGKNAIYVDQISSIVAMNAGLGAIAVAYITEE